MSRWKAVVFAALVSVGLAGILGWAQYPNCGWGCSANDVNVTEAYVVGPDSCSVGETVSGRLYVTS